MNTDIPTTREVPLEPRSSALLFIDVQNFSCRREGGEFKGAPESEMAGKYGYYFDRLKSVAIPNMQRLQRAFQAAGIEVLYTTIESLTKDGRDRSLDYKITGFNVPKGSWDSKVIDEIAPGEDEMVQRLHAGPGDIGVAGEIPAGAEQRVRITALAHAAAQIVFQRGHAGSRSIRVMAQIPACVEQGAGGA